MKRLKFLPLAMCLALAAAASLWADTPGDAPTTKYVTTSHGSLGLSGSVYLYDYAPAFSGASNNFDLYAFILNLDGASADGKTGLHAQFRYRDTRLRSYYLS
ncbi:MAG: hypothetical protein KGI84_02530, partial [Elusimicrobia bacterium]|nr:hypothetical protein [Elusimicrobiota bacterium]